jgi:hypothetical protein
MRHILNVIFNLIHGCGDAREDPHTERAGNAKPKIE